MTNQFVLQFTHCFRALCFGKINKKVKAFGNYEISEAESENPENQSKIIVFVQKSKFY